jgi:hypothetical protein
MPYLVLTPDELTVKGGPDRPYSDQVSAALDAMERDGYTFVAIDPAAGAGGPLYLFHRSPTDESVPLP